MLVTWERSEPALFPGFFGFHEVPMLSIFRFLFGYLAQGGKKVKTKKANATQVIQQSNII